MVVHSLFVKFNSNLWINFGIKQPPAAYFFWLVRKSRQKDPRETPISALARGLFIRPIRAQV